MRWEGWAGAILVDGCGGLGSGQYGGQNARTSKHSAVRRMGWCNPGGVLWRLRVRSICVAKIQRFPSILNSFARLGCRLGRLGRVVERLGGHAGGGGGTTARGLAVVPPSLRSLAALAGYLAFLAVTLALLAGCLVLLADFLAAS